MRWNTFTDVAFMENIQASSYSYVLEEMSPIVLETLVELREDIACFQNI